MSPILFAFLATALIGSISCGWREVEVPRSLTVSGNHSGTLREGDVVELLCTSSGVLPYSTLRWTRQQGNIQTSTWTRGPSPLALALRVTPALHGSQYFCSAPFTESLEGHYFPYTVNSETSQLTVAGAGSPQTPNLPGRVEMYSTATVHRVGDLVDYSCSTHDIPFTVVDVIQAKANYEIQLHMGLQPWRQARINMTAADHGSAVFCRVSAAQPDDYRERYTLESNRVPIHISP